MITTQLESFTERLEELKPLLPLHYEELALDKDKVPLSPQYPIYLKRDELGELIFPTIRENGDLIGYYIGFIAFGLHYQTCLTCITDIFYIHPEHRGKQAGLLLFEFTEKELKKRGVQRWFVGSKLHLDATPMLQRLGFEPIEKFCSKWIGE